MNKEQRRRSFSVRTGGEATTQAIIEQQVEVITDAHYRTSLLPCEPFEEHTHSSAADRCAQPAAGDQGWKQRWLKMRRSLGEE